MNHYRLFTSEINRVANKPAFVGTHDIVMTVRGSKGHAAQSVFTIAVEVIVGVDGCEACILAQVTCAGTSYPLVLVGVLPGIKPPLVQHH